MKLIVMLRMTSHEGKASNAVVLALGKRRMRVLAVDGEDTIELRPADRVWIDEHDNEFCLDFISPLFLSTPAWSNATEIPSGSAALARKAESP